MWMYVVCVNDVNLIHSLGSHTWSGLMGQAIEGDIHLVPINSSFKKIYCEDFPALTETIRKGLSNDALYLYEICLILSEGTVVPPFTNLPPNTHFKVPNTVF